MIKGSMLSVLETAVETKIEKTNYFVKNGIFSISDRTEHDLSFPIYSTTIMMAKYRYFSLVFLHNIDITIHITFSFIYENLFLNLGQYFLNTYSSVNIS